MATLVEATSTLISDFSSHPLHAVALRNELLDRASAVSSNNNNNALARSTATNSGNATENFTSYTNLSDGSSAYSVDPNDLRRLDSEVELFKTHFAQVKMQWIESNVKRRTLEKLLQGNASHDIIDDAQHTQSEADRLQSKQALQAKKAEANEIRRQIEQVAKELDESLHQRLTPSIEEARTLTRSIQDMELQLAMLRTSRPEEERLTIDEANQYLEDQVTALQDLAAALERNKAEVVKRNGEFSEREKEVARLGSERAHLAKLETEARNAIKNKDKRIEEACRQLADRAALLSAVLGIKSVQPCPNGELRVTYDLGSGKMATLAIYSDVQKRCLTGAALLNSSTSIEDIVTQHRRSGDLQELVLEVLARIA